MLGGSWLEGVSLEFGTFLLFFVVLLELVLFCRDYHVLRWVMTYV